MKVSNVLTGLALAIAPMTALHAADDDASDTPAAGNEEITYEDALAKCSEFINDPQIVKIEFKVSCFDESLSWEETDTVEVEQANEGSLGYSLVMKEKFFTPDLIIPIVRDPATTSCPVLSQVRTARQAELTLSCDEFVNDYQEPQALATQCESLLADAPAQTESTGRVFSPCESVATN